MYGLWGWKLGLDVNSGLSQICAVSICFLKPQHPQLRKGTTQEPSKQKNCPLYMQNAVISIVLFLRCCRLEIYLQIVLLTRFQWVRFVLGFCWCIWIRTTHTGDNVFKLNGWNARNLVLLHLDKRKYFYCSSFTVECGRNSGLVSMMTHGGSSYAVVNVLGWNSILTFW